MPQYFFILCLFIFSSLAALPSDQYYELLNQKLTPVSTKEDFLKVVTNINNKFLNHSVKKPGTTRFYIVRHGESFGNIAKMLSGQTLDEDLTPEGYKMALEEGKKFHDQNVVFDSVISSPMLRTRRTAEAILSQLNHTPTSYLDKRWIEKHSGQFDGRSSQDPEYLALKEKTQDERNALTTFWEKFAYVMDKGDEKEESFKIVYDRAMECILDTHKTPNLKGKTILVTTHSFVIRSLFLLEAALDQHVDIDSSKFLLPNCSVLIMDVDNETTSIIYSEKLNFK